MIKENCNKCIFFSKKPGIKNYFIFICKYWGLESINKLPNLIIFESIGKKCPFFKEKINQNKSKDHDKNSDGLNIII